LTHLTAALRRHRLRAWIYDDFGKLTPARVSEAQVLHLLFALDFSQGARELAPAAIAAAAHGELDPLARLTRGVPAEAPGRDWASASAEIGSRAAGRAAQGPAGLLSAAKAPESDSAISIALFAATYCLESELPWSPDSPVAGRRATLRRLLASLPRATTAPFAPATALAASAVSLCLDWPATPPPPPSPAGVSATPTLILSGEDDLRTPYEQDLVIAAGYSNARLLRIPDVGHSTVSSDSTGCAENAMIEFIASGAAPAACSGSGEPQALPLPPSSLRKAYAAASRSHLAGQVAAAAAMTLADLLAQASPSGGGLRGGYWRPRGENAFELHGMIDVPGVALSGTIRIGGHLAGPPEVTGQLTVRGRLTGKLTLRGRALSGRVGGARVYARLAAL
jgi:hypothetical protein